MVDQGSRLNNPIWIEKLGVMESTLALRAQLMSFTCTGSVPAADVRQREPGGGKAVETRLL